MERIETGVDDGEDDAAVDGEAMPTGEIDSWSAFLTARSVLPSIRVRWRYALRALLSARCSPRAALRALLCTLRAATPSLSF